MILIEGSNLVREALRSGLRIRTLVATEDRWEREKGWLRELEEEQGAEIALVSKAAMRAISAVETPPGIIAVADRLQAAFTEEPVPARFAAFLFSIRDPGNLGTLVRTAEAAGFEFLACSPDTADPEQPKVIRASGGSIFRVPVIEIAQPDSYLKSLIAAGVAVYALQPRGGANPGQLQVRTPAMILVGSESHGLPSSLPAGCQPLSIPMAGKVESLNASTAAAICFYYFAFFSAGARKQES